MRHSTPATTLFSGRILPATAALAVGIGLTATTVAEQSWPGAPEGVRMASFPPGWNTIQVFRAIVGANAKPVAKTSIPGTWLVHFDKDQDTRLPGAIVIDIGPLTRLVSAACLTPRKS